MDGPKPKIVPIRELEPLVRCYLDLSGDQISEPEFSDWLSALKVTPQELARFREEALKPTSSSVKHLR